jgi:hypothetical protein
MFLVYVPSCIILAFCRSKKTERNPYISLQKEKLQPLMFPGVLSFRLLKSAGVQGINGCLKTTGVMLWLVFEAEKSSILPVWIVSRK